MTNPLSRRRLLALSLLPLLPRPATAAEPLRLLAFGDSLIAGYGLPQAEGFVPQLQAALQAAGHAVVVLNGGNSGDTTAAGLARLDWALADAPQAVLLCLGANDALRGLSPAETKSNLQAILQRLRVAGLPVLLAGMLAPRNLGADYAAEFDPLFAALAASEGVPLYPFFLEGVAADPRLNQPDGIHPNAQGVAEIVRRILPAVEALLAAAA